MGTLCWSTEKRDIIHLNSAMRKVAERESKLHSQITDLLWSNNLSLSTHTRKGKKRIAAKKIFKKCNKLLVHIPRSQENTGLPFSGKSKQRQQVKAVVSTPAGCCVCCGKWHGWSKPSVPPLPQTASRSLFVWHSSASRPAQPKLPGNGVFFPPLPFRK